MVCSPLRLFFDGVRVANLRLLQMFGGMAASHGVTTGSKSQKTKHFCGDRRLMRPQFLSRYSRKSAGSHQFSQKEARLRSGDGNPN